MLSVEPQTCSVLRSSISPAVNAAELHIGMTTGRLESVTEPQSSEGPIRLVRSSNDKRSS